MSDKQAGKDQEKIGHGGYENKVSGLEVHHVGERLKLFSLVT